ncbi:MAG TPA: hypothetical protein V6D15_00680 [Oculatellaceae cyanobacterium]|jgi:hypothetical protein
MQLLKQLYMSSTRAKPHQCDRLHKFVNFSHFSWKIVTTIALIAAVSTSAQAQTKGFSNMRINGVQLEVPLNDNNNTLMPLPTINGSGQNGRTFVFTADLYNANGVPPGSLPNDLFTSTFSFQNFGNNSLDAPNDFARLYEGSATLVDPVVVSYTYTYDQDGTFQGALFGELFSEDTDYDIPILSSPRGDGNGVFDTKGRGFGFTLVAGENSVTPVPEATPTLGLIMLGACGVASQLKKFKLARKPIN